MALAVEILFLFVVLALEIMFLFVILVCFSMFGYRVKFQTCAFVADMDGKDCCHNLRSR